MKKRIKVQKNKLTLYLEPEFMALLRANAGNDYVKVATWTKQFLMKNLLQKNNEESQMSNENGNRMGNK